MDEKSCLIALLEWELAASQAREQALRRAVRQMLQGKTEGLHLFRPRTGDMRRLLELIHRPADDDMLRRRLLNAQSEAVAPYKTVIEAMENILIAKSAAIGALRHELDHAKGTV